MFGSICDCDCQDHIGVPIPPGCVPERHGSRIPKGGKPGQYLAMTEDGPAWVDLPEPEHELPAGGLDGQVLTKNSGKNDDVGWKTPVSKKDVSEAIEEAITEAIKEAY